MTSFQTAVGVLGALLVIGALLSGLARRSVLSLAALFVVAGFILGEGGTGVLQFNASSGFVSDLATVALVVILFRDGLEVDSELLQRQWRVPLRKLGIGMPITAGVIAVIAHGIVGLSWLEAFLLGALLSPTDPVLTSGVLTDVRVPRIIRHSLNLESGLNDGLALPAVLALASALDPRMHHFVWWHFVLQDIGVGLAFGVGCGLIGSTLMPRTGRGALGDTIPAHQKALYGLGIAFATYSATVLPPRGNGLIAVFVAAIVIGIRRPDLRHHFAQGVGEIAEVVMLGVFVVFGSLLTIRGLFTDGWGAVAVVAGTFLLARPIGISLALAGTRLDAATKAFIAWFGPKGVSTMTFSLLVLERHIAAGPRIVNLAALVVFCSILLHGITDNPGANWIARRGVAERAEPDPAPLVAS
ncbi:MAG TPA: cation:proton antiporter [Solirubrobacteraceae bacterium]|nr:cation:proton antiporter [Solirubrobacteraceae bacterium]